MKKFAKIITVVIALALLLLTPGTTVAVNGLINLKAAADDEPYQFTAPTQSSTPFSREEFAVTGMENWQTPTDSRLASQQVTASNNTAFHNLYPHSTLTDTELDGHNAYVIATKTPTVSAQGCYTTSEITLPANSYFEISVEYCLKHESADSAFGTFYLNDEAITLNGAGWRPATFLVKTDLLASATVKPTLYFGSDDKVNGNALGSIYFANFKVTAIKQSAYDAATNNGNTHKIDFSQKDEYVLVDTLNLAEFTASGENDGEAWSQSPITNISDRLGFNVLSKDASDTNVMLMKAHAGNARLKRNITFNCQPYEIYMFQFYSIATAATNFTGFYFNITTEDDSKTNPQLIENLTNNSNYYNGWQLNTVFFVAGFDLNQKYKLSFTLVDPTTETGSATGWACIDELKIYKVSGDYAEANKSTTGVHGTLNLTYTETGNINNGGFITGTASEVKNSTYPYPLAAQDWTPTKVVDGIQNGIVNMADGLWCEAFGSNPKSVPGSRADNNNNFYMMHNLTNTNNVLTSPTFTTTANQKVCLSFDAYTDLDMTESCTVQAQIWAAIDDKDDIKLGNPVDIDSNEWRNYKIYISENEYAVSRSYYIQFTFTGVGFVYLDNVRLNTSTAEDVDIDLANPLTVRTIWQADDNNVVPSISDQGLYLENIGGRKATVKNTFAYNFALDSYYEIIVTATDAQNAYLSMNGYEGNLKTDNTDETEYKMYLYVSDNTTPNFQITLGSLDEVQQQSINAQILISKLQVNNIEKEAFEAAQSKAATDDNILVLSQVEATTTEDDTKETHTDDNSFFGENWWYLIPSLITAAAILLAIATFLFRKIKFEKHITKKHTSYARDMRLKNQRNKIVAQKAAKVDNITDESQSN